MVWEDIYTANKYKISVIDKAEIETTKTPANKKIESNEFSQQELQTQYERKVTNSLKNYLKTLQKKGYSANTKNLLHATKKQSSGFLF